MSTYYVQFASLEEPRLWHTVARVDDRMLAREMAWIAGTSFMRTTTATRYVGRAVSRSALKGEGTLHHAEWELGFGKHRQYGEALRRRAERRLQQASA